MKQMDDSYLVFGPVPSRRLGRSIGVNNIPPKQCTYSCIYCQLGHSTTHNLSRREFFKPEVILKAVEKKVRTIDERVDYLTIVPDGEPTLDSNLGLLVRGLKDYSIPVAVITNSSLLWDEKVREELMQCDLVSVKVDTVDFASWRKINRPTKSLDLQKVLQGISDFSDLFGGRLLSETMLVDNLDYPDEHLDLLAEFLGSLKSLHKAFVSIPTRPPAFDWVKQPNLEIINKVFQKISAKLSESRVEYLIGYEGDNFFSPDKGSVENILAIASVHPLKKGALKVMLDKHHLPWQTVEDLVEEKKLVEVQFEDDTFYIRSLPHHK